MKDDRKRYPMTCPVCGKVQYVCKSILQEDFGLDDHGMGSCLGCNTLLKLQFDKKNARMNASIFAVKEVNA